MQSASPDGQIRVMNEAGTVYAFVYHATAFNDAGIPRPSPTEPMSWEEWDEAAAELSIWEGDRLVRSGYAARMDAPFWKEAFQNHVTILVRQADGDVLSAEAGALGSRLPTQGASGVPFLVAPLFHQVYDAKLELEPYQLFKHRCSLILIRGTKGNV